MVGACARHLFEEVVLRELLDKHAAHVGLRERERKAKPHRAGTDDDDASDLTHVRGPEGASAAFRRHTLSLTSVFATTSLVAPTQPLWVRSNTMPIGSRYLAS